MLNIGKPRTYSANADMARSNGNAVARRGLDQFGAELAPPPGTPAAISRYTLDQDAYDKAVRDARLRFSQAIAEAKGYIVGGIESAEFIRLAAKYVIGEIDFPAKNARAVPPHIAEHVRTCRAYVRAGLIDGQVLSDRMNRAAKTAIASLLAEKKEFRRFEAVASIIVSKAALRRSDAIGDVVAAEKARAARTRRTQLYRARHGKAKDERTGPRSFAPPPLGYVDVAEMIAPESRPNPTPMAPPTPPSAPAAPGTHSVMAPEQYVVNVESGPEEGWVS